MADQTSIPETPAQDISNFVNVRAPDGTIGSLPPEQVQSYFNIGYKPVSHDELRAYAERKEFESPIEETKTAVEGLGQGVAGPLFTAGERLAGASPERMLKREQYNPGIKGSFEAAGLLGSAFIPGLGEYAEASKAAELAGAAEKIAAKELINPLSAQSVLTGTAERIANKIGIPAVEGGSALQKITGYAGRGAIETALFQTGDEVSHLMMNDPNQSVGSAIAHIGLAGLMGGGISGGLGAVNPLFKAAAGDKIAQEFENFKGRVHEHMENPNPVERMTQELEQYVKNSDSVFDEVYGSSGLKADAIQKLMPNELSDKMVGQAQDFLQQSRHFMEEMNRNPDLYPRNLSARFQRDFNIFSESMSQPADPAGVFNALQDFKQRMQANFNVKYLPKVDPAYEFTQGVRGLGSSLKTALEDPEVWGNAGKVQQDINKGFSEYLGPRKDFEKKFMTKVNGDPVIDPGKIQTYINQTGKAGQKIKQDMLGNFIDASEGYREAIGNTHARFGIESPFEPSSLSFVKSTLGDLTPGARLADAFINKGLAQVAGKGMGTAIGGGIGSVLGHGWIGALIGEHALGPFFSSVLPSLVKPILGTATRAEGLKSAVDYGMAVVKGERLLEKTTSNLFKAATEVVPGKLIPQIDALKRLDEKLKGYQTDQSPLMNIGGSTAYYLPDHGTAMVQSASNAIQFLNQARPQMQKQLPYDAEQKVPGMLDKAFERKLEIAAQPLIVLEHIKNGTLSSNDVTTMQNLYPGLYQRLHQKLMTQMMGSLSKGETLPYATRMGLSLFLGQPLDSTMVPKNMLATQAVFAMPPSPSQQSNRPHLGQMNKLSKSALMDSTVLQNRQRSQSRP